MFSNDAPELVSLDQALWLALRDAPADVLLAWARALSDGGALAVRLSAARERPDEARQIAVRHLKFCSHHAPWFKLTQALPEQAPAIRRAAAHNNVSLPASSPSPPSPVAPSTRAAPPAAAQPATAQPATLEGLLLSLFREQELRNFVKKLDERLEHTLPGPPVTPSQLAADAADALARRGLVNDGLFSALAEERPGRAAEILRVQARQTSPDIDPAAPPSPTFPDPPPPPPPRRAPRPPTPDELLAALTLALPEPCQQAALRVALAEAGLDVPHLGATPATRWRPIVAALGHTPEGRRHLLEAALLLAPQAPALKALAEETR